MVVLVTDTVYRWLGLWQFTYGCACNRYSLQMVVLGADTVYRGLCWLWQTQFTDGCACNRHSLQMVVLVTDTVYRWLCLLWQFICGWACCDSLQVVVHVVTVYRWLCLLCQTQKQLTIQRLGAEAALTTICGHFGHTLPQQLPDLWNTCTQPLQPSSSSSGTYINTLGPCVQYLPSRHWQEYTRTLLCICDR